jgi:hypothetical protein
MDCRLGETRLAAFETTSAVGEIHGAGTSYPRDAGA